MLTVVVVSIEKLSKLQKLYSTLPAFLSSHAAGVVWFKYLFIELFVACLNRVCAYAP